MTFSLHSSSTFFLFLSRNYWKHSKLLHKKNIFDIFWYLVRLFPKFEHFQKKTTSTITLKITTVTFPFTFVSKSKILSSKGEHHFDKKIKLLQKFSLSKKKKKNYLQNSYLKPNVILTLTLINRLPSISLRFPSRLLYLAHAKRDIKITRWMER